MIAPSPLGMGGLGLSLHKRYIFFRNPFPPGILLSLFILIHLILPPLRGGHFIIYHMASRREAYYILTYSIMVSAHYYG